ncbi:hypothetical protein ABW21_db0205209 [Orbilia brochopaga]|nr:hypothetical protein ABW21_db0205209 [Drechslerella brochopaga]
MTGDDWSAGTETADGNRKAAGDEQEQVNYRIHQPASELAITTPSAVQDGALLHPHPEPAGQDAAGKVDDEKVKLKGEVHRLVAPRDQKYQSNFVEFRNNKIVYRRYAGLFFCVCVDANDNELAYLEAIHFFVEVLDAFFGNVCELDLVFNFYKVYAILDEVFLAGEIEEASKQTVLTRLEHLDKLE